MTVLELCEYALKKAGIPRRVDEILASLKNDALWDKTTQTPENLIAAELSKAVLKKSSVFERFGPNCYGLKVLKAPTGKKGYVYILWNPTFRDYVKVGKAKSVAERLISLNSAVPHNFEPKYVLVSTAYEQAEAIVQAYLYKKGKHQKGDNAEFFHCSIRDALHELKRVARTLPEGDNEVLPWMIDVEVKFKTLKKSVARRYVEADSGVKQDSESVVGSSLMSKSSMGVRLMGRAIICKKSVADTFAEAISKFGTEKVAALGLKRDKFDLVSKVRAGFPYQNAVRDLGGGWFVNTHASVEANRRTLMKIIAALSIDAEVI